MNNRSTIIILALILLYFWFRNRNGSKIINGGDNTQLCEVCRLAYDQMESAKNEMFNFWEEHKDLGGGGVITDGAVLTQLTIQFRGKVNFYLSHVADFLDCLRLNEITPRAEYINPWTDLPPGTNTTDIVYFNPNATSIPATRFDPYLVNARWSPSSPYWQQPIYTGAWLQEKANLKEYGERGLVFDFSNINWNC